MNETMSENPTPSLPAGPAMTLSESERKAIERLRMTPEQHQAERAVQEQALVERMPLAVRQARDAKAARLASMSAQQRGVYHLGQHLVAVVRMLREETNRGVALADVLGAPELSEAEALTWFFAELQKTKPSPLTIAPVESAGGKP